MALIATACVLLTGALFWWVFTAAPESQGGGAAEARRLALEERKKAVYDNLKDLHFEHLAGKLSDSDYDRTRQMLEQEAARVVAELQQA